MRWDEIWLTFQFNMRDFARQPEHIAMLLACAIFFGLTMVSSDLISQILKAPTATHKIALFGDADIIRRNLDKRKFVLVDHGDRTADDLVRTGTIDVAMIVDNDFHKRMEGADGDVMPTIKLRYDVGRADSMDVVDQATDALVNLQSQIRDQRLTAAAVPERWTVEWKHAALSSGDVSHLDVQRKAARGFTMWVVLMAAWFGSAIGCALIAEELKKGTLIVLFISPTSKASIIVSHFLFTIVATLLILIPTALAISWFVLSAHHGPTMLAVPLEIRAPGLPLVAVVMAVLSIVSLSAAIAVLCSTFMRSFDQLATFSGLAAGIAAIGASVVYSSGGQFTRLYGLLPFSGSAVCMTEALLGTVDWTLLMVSIASSVCYVTAALYISCRRFSDAGQLERYVQGMQTPAS
jgi:ABC-type Na+ efflux pump permease subunit